MHMHNPPHSGEIIREFCIEALNINGIKAAQALGVTRKTFSTFGVYEVDLLTCPKLVPAKAGPEAEAGNRLY